MAEYYPLLAKAVGSLPSSTPEARRVVYERARKALIGQLRTLHPPIPDEDIESESVALDQAIARLEAELAVAAPEPEPAKTEPTKTPAPEDSKTAKPTAASSPAKTTAPPKPAAPSKTAGPGKPAANPKSTRDADPSGSPAPRAVLPPRSKAKTPVANGNPVANEVPVEGTEAKAAAPMVPPRVAPLPPRGGALVPPSAEARSDIPPDAPPSVPAVLDNELPLPAAAEPVTQLKPPRPVPPDASKGEPSRLDPQRPIAPQPPAAKGPRRRLWIIPVVVFVVVATVAFAAWKLRDRPETVAQGKLTTVPAPTDSGKIAERVGGPDTPTPSDSGQPKTTSQPAETPAPAASPQPAPAAPANPELPVAHRAALLVEAPSEPNKVKTFLGTVVWKLNNVPQGPNDAVGLAVEADVDLPDDKMKVVVTFAKNTEASLPASHTINIRYSVDPGSYTGDVKQISVPQMRPESSPSGEPLAGVTVQIVPNSFLVGLSPGNAETANTDLIRRLQWIDIPMLLDSGKIAKLTFEKSDSGQRDLNEALDAWAKQ